MKALIEFMRHFGISADGSPGQVLGSVARAFSRLPYENITKIIKREESGSAEKARRYPEEVIRDHIAWGAGGTCFSLTSTLMDLVRNLGWKAEYILADRRYGQDTHCALLIWIDDVPYLLDPGYLIIDAIPLNSGREREIEASFNRLILAPDGDQNKISLSTVQRETKTYRLTYKTCPVDEGEFRKAWDASFAWDMMRYPLLTRTVDSGQIYLKGSRLQISDADVITRKDIREEDLPSRIATEFRIHPSLVAHAVSILKERGEVFGKTSAR
jgi:arylamine N-acetyltransferase